MRTKLAVDFWIGARLALLQALITVAIFVLFTVDRGLSFRMKAALMLKIHSERSLLKKPLGVKVSALNTFEAVRIGYGAGQKAPSGPLAPPSLHYAVISSPSKHYLITGNREVMV